MQSALELFQRLDAPIAVVAHDAGAANVIAAMLLEADPSAVRISVKGPAKQIFQTRLPGFVTDCSREHLLECRSLLSGTSLPGAFEHEVRRQAKASGIYVVALVDHWTNYRERFVRDREEVLPDEIWVVDEYARQLAEARFPDVKVVLVRNFYLQQLVKQIRSLESQKVRDSDCNILYVLEPVQHNWGRDGQSGEFQALDFFVSNLSGICSGVKPRIRLRPHPSETGEKYQRWIDANRKLDISLDYSADLAESIAWSDMVIGCQTYAMVVALAAGRTVISALPPWAPPCVLPHAEIVKLKDLVE